MTRTYGADLSHWDGEIDWQAVLADGRIKFAILKASEGLNYKDTQFEKYKAGCKSIGLPWGAYHFFRPQYSAAEQARWFKSCVGPGCQIYALDVEVAGTDILDKAKEFLDNLQVPQKIIYTGPSFWTSLIGDKTWAADYDLWIANYEVAAPWLPKPWTTYKIWQYSDHGRIPGIPARVDENWFDGSESEVRTYFKNGGVPMPPVELPGKVKTTAEKLYLRSCPYGMIKGYVPLGTVLGVTGCAMDIDGRLWYQSGLNSYFASWWCEIVA